MMHQISDKVFAEDFLFEVDIATPLLPSPYEEFPFLLIENFLDEATCKVIIDTAKQSSDTKSAELRSRHKTLNPKIRKTKILRLTDLHQKLYDEALETIRPKIESFFTLSMTLSTKPQLLEYTKGSFYKAHSDDSSVLVDKKGTIKGFKQVAPQRKVTTLLFISEYSDKELSPYQFSGGELTFNYFIDSENRPLLLTPKMGTIIIFGSNPIYTHEVKVVEDGYRLTVAQWHDAIL
ncbi:MAG: 2OG-Fe(II) oxygenase [Sulfurimonadaceae bacterium]